MKKIKGFSIAEVLIFVTIFCLFITFSLPIHKKQSLLKKTNEMHHIASTVMIYVNRAHLNGKLLENINFSSKNLPITKYLKKFIKKVYVKNGIIIVIGNKDYLSGQDIKIAVIPTEGSNSLNWQCKTDKAQNFNYLPSACKNLCANNECKFQ